MDEVGEFLKGLGVELEDLSNEHGFNPEMLRDIQYRRHSRGHARVLGAMASTGRSLGYAVDIERRLRPSGKRSFVPDLILTRGERLEMVVEYESTNSSDKRIWEKDYANYRRYVKSPEEGVGAPKTWLIVTTLEHGPVRKWSNWARAGERGYQEVLKSPYSYWMPRFRDRLVEHAVRDTRLFLANVWYEGIDLELPEAVCLHAFHWATAG